MEIITLDTRSLYKITQRVNGRKYLLGYSATIDELVHVHHVDLADLVEVLEFPAGDHMVGSR
ncbi:hypothetical protein [Nonomuraea sp. NEAU-A123]|uniref:hypothetical protein n=1 Tax=Nonomuraea sp. NEAU-A123 TaxID=2839649 RepID=UPI001BE4BA81|nr:hypothetical protein [Nonomuraea sp. NEAU-A123]MBT2226387.1 hypothetical protein [Nonomuraea sp. NEAU-A123]